MAIGNTISCTLTLYAGVYFSISFQRIVSSLHRTIMNFYFQQMTKTFVWFRYYKRAYQELFLSNDAKSSENSSESNNQEASDYYRFGWLLFLVLRIQSFSRFKDLVTSTNELVSVLVRTCAMIKFTSIFSSHAARQSMYGVLLLVNLNVTNTSYFACLQAVLIIHVPVRLRSFNIKDSPYFGNGNQLFI